jgi:hypothetical protein
MGVRISIMFTTYKVELIAGDYTFTVYNNEGDNNFILMSLEGWDDVITPLRKTAEKINGDGIFFSSFAKKPARNIELTVKAIGYPINDLLAEIEPLMDNAGLVQVKVYKYGEGTIVETSSGFFSDNILWKTTGDDALASISITLPNPIKDVEVESEWFAINASNGQTDFEALGFGDTFDYAEIYDEEDNLLEQPYDNGSFIIYTDAGEESTVSVYLTTYNAPGSQKFKIVLIKLEGEEIALQAETKIEVFVTE